MTGVAANEHLAHLLEVQAGLLDAYLEQNLGERYACAIVVWQQNPPARVRVVTNVQDCPAQLRALVREHAQHVADSPEPMALVRAPLFLATDDQAAPLLPGS